MAHIVMNFSGNPVSFSKGCRIQLILLLFQQRLIFLFKKEIPLPAVILAFFKTAFQYFILLRPLFKQYGKQTSKAAKTEHNIGHFPNEQGIIYLQPNGGPGKYILPLAHKNIYGQRHKKQKCRDSPRQNRKSHPRSQTKPGVLHNISKAQQDKSA